MSVWSTIAIAVLLPYALNWLAGFVRSRSQQAAQAQQQQQQQQGAQPAVRRGDIPLTQAEKFWIGALTVGAIALVFLSVSSRDTDILQTWNVAVDSPTFLVRNRYREYMAKSFPGWTEDGNYGAGGETQPPPPTWSADDLEEVQALAKLYRSLRSQESRRLYQLVGHDAFVDCSWCTTGADHLVFLMPQMGLAYTTAMAVFGLATAAFLNAQRRSWWRLTVGGALAAVLVAELAVLYDGIDSLDEATKEHYLNAPQLRALRQLAFALIAAGFAAALVLLKSGRGLFYEHSPEQKLLNTLQLLSETRMRLYGTRQVRTAMMNDAGLRSKMIKYGSKRQAKVDSVSKDPQYKSLQEETKTVHAPVYSEVLKASLQQATNFLRSAHLEGFIGVDLFGGSEPERRVAGDDSGESSGEN
ncbi:hypothetical protein DFJ73DRAFT_775232 [Zopfochytrium polystomum]|nr:hypothetical protein DFJ73DRAFT_775232 [Zopfochytrium polystomum]